MITAHAPSGYVLARLAGWQGWVFVAACFGAIWPDLDLLFFYFVDDRAINHHRYWVHAPAFALGVSVLLWVIAVPWRAMAFAFGTGWFVHILLDTPVGGIMWRWPLSNELYRFYRVPASEHHWLVTFLIHPSFLAELAIWAAAVWLFLRGRRARVQGTDTPRP